VLRKREGLEVERLQKAALKQASAAAAHKKVKDKLKKREDDLHD